MKTKLFALSALTVLAISGVAVADPSAPPASGTTVNAGGQGASSTTVQSTPAQPSTQGTVTTSQTTVAPVQPVQQQGAVPTSTTRVTSADATPIPPASEPVNRDTVTLNQSIRPNRPLLFTGGLLFAGSYATTAALTAANTDGGGDKNMYIPVVGPWLHLADSGNNESTTDTLLVAGSGVLQGVGLGMAVVSLFVPEKIPAATIQAGNVKMNMTATSFGRSSAGIGAVGEF